MTSVPAASLAASAPPLPASRPFAADLGLGLGIVGAPNVAGNAFENLVALSAKLIAAWTPAGRGWGARLTLGASTERAQPLTTGQAWWRRAALSFGPTFRTTLARPDVGLDLHAELMVAALGLRGDGLSVTRSEWSEDLGLAAGARLWLRSQGKARPWLELGVQAWPREQIVYTRPDGEGASLPPVEMVLTVGMSVGSPARRTATGAARGPAGSSATASLARDDSL